MCPSGCPEFDHKLAGRGRAVAFCQVCGEAVYPDELYYKRGGTVVCRDCGESMDLYGLIDLCGAGEVLSMFGFERMN